MAGVEMDATEVRMLAVDLGRAASKVVPLVDAVVEKGAVNVKNDMADQTEGSWFSGVGSAISYDRTRSFNFIGAEIGPVIGRYGGSLGDIFFMGGANGGGGTGDLDGAANREEPKFMKALGGILGDVL